MTLTDYVNRLLAVAALGVAAFVPALGLATADAAAAGPGNDDNITSPTLDPCQTGEALDCPPPEPPCPEGTFPLPVLDGNDIDHVTCVPCENLPFEADDICPPPECDPETEECEPPECDPDVEDCDPPPECDPEVEECDKEPPGGNPGPDPVPDQPVPGRPNFTG